MLPYFIEYRVRYFKLLTFLSKKSLIKPPKACLVSVVPYKDIEGDGKNVCIECSK